MDHVSVRTVWLPDQFEVGLLDDQSGSGALRSPNFQFLTRVNPLLVELGARAERYALDDPNTAMIKIRQMGELLVQNIASSYGIATTTITANKVSRPKEQRVLIDELFQASALPPEIASLFHEIRKEGNDANHNFKGDQARAVSLLRFAWKCGVWTYRSFFDKKFKSGPFIPPIAKPSDDEESKREIERLKVQYEETVAQMKSLQDQYADESLLRKLAEEDRQQAYRDLDAAMALVEEETAKLNEKIAEYERQLAEKSKATKPNAEQKLLMLQTGESVASEELSEADTREIIDMQLRQAGWKVDTKTLRYSAGTRPEKEKNLAIAEWPTATGPADYILFIGLKPVAVVEAKKKNIDVAGRIDQAKRYAEGFKLAPPMIDPAPKTGDRPWQDRFQLPFVFSTNGRAYLKQLRTKSGVWFYDARRSENLSRPLDGWYSPAGLANLLAQDHDGAHDSLTSESSDYLPIRYYQHEAIAAVEQGIIDGRREMLVAMATGTGKTRTCICLCYRLVKAQRFNRILFLVDRTSLGVQAGEAFSEVKLEHQQSFPEIYDVKQIGDVKPDADTRMQVATIQGMMHRILNNDNPPTVDQFDCIVIDECHRGYTLDQELSDKELQFRDETDYISKYMRVLEHFDAVKIGLTATPAMHTLTLFGGPERKAIYQYSYRKAVIDGFLVDHEPPFRADTQKSREGIRFEKGQDLPLLNTRTNEVELSRAEDDVQFDIEGFNVQVLSEGFNRAVCQGLAREIDPHESGKTLIFCVDDTHADMVVDLLKEELQKLYPGVTDDTVKKITGNTDRPLEQIRFFKNEKFPSIAVTVDLLTTGIDVPEIDKLVFLRRVRSRILYEQMIGRATRKCPDLYGDGKHKDRFYIYDCVDLYPSLLPYTSMKPVVARPSINFAQLARELQTINDEFVEEVKIQFLGKLSRKVASATEAQAFKIAELSHVAIEDLLAHLAEMSPKQVGAWLSYHQKLVEYLDATPMGEGKSIPIDESEDQFHGWTRGYGAAERPEDYLESFRKYIQDHLTEMVALQIVTQRPSDLTRAQLKELRLTLDNDGFTESSLRVAFREKTNHEIAASIIGFIRSVMFDTPLIDYQVRVDRAMAMILESQTWNPEQTRWLNRIAKQLREETIVDLESFDAGEFRKQGGFHRINKTFDGKLEALLKQIADTIWSVAG